ncbi:CpaF family protein [Lacticigenium naphthae]|uniref:CpaF family protein n=1 Tax=Lacticigenium naphthae TaxID=515351 RepID=UPI0004103A0C|nr:CpaF family protein [Lacticigenium naphthae]
MDYRSFDFSKVTTQQTDSKKKETTLTTNEPTISKAKRLELAEITEVVLQLVIDEITDEMVGGDDEEKNQIRRTIIRILNRTLGERDVYLSQADKGYIEENVMNEIFDFGPITELLQDEAVNEVMVNGPHLIFIETMGKIRQTDIIFKDDAHVMRIIDKIISPLGRRVDEGSPLVDARLPDGSRVNVIIPPLSVNGPVITIRKFAADPFTVQDLIGFETLDKKMATVLKAGVRGQLNMLVSGGTGSGKTTLLNALSSFIPGDERIITIEDAAEVQLQQEHVVTLESRPANIEGKGRVTIRDLVVNALRMRPDRIVVGEVRSGEALDMLQAMNTGHDGSLTTIHANSPRDCISRLETLVMMAGMELPTRAIREQIASAIDVIVQVDRMMDGTRKVVKISEVTGMEGETVTLQDLFVFEQERVDKNGKVIGRHIPTGVVPAFMKQIKDNGEQLSTRIFTEPEM